MISKQDKGIRSSEFYVAAIMLLPWLFKQFGIDLYLQPDDINQAAEAIKAASENGFDLSAIAGVAYIIGRPWLKSKMIENHNG